VYPSEGMEEGHRPPVALRHGGRQSRGLVVGRWSRPSGGYAAILGTDLATKRLYKCLPGHPSCLSVTVPALDRAGGNASQNY